MRYMIVVVVAFGLSSSGMAAEIPKNGPVEGRYYSHIVQKIDDVQTSDGMKTYVNESFAFHEGRTRGGLFDGTTERCLGYGRYSEGGAVKEVGRCSVVDSDGDKIFDEYEMELAGSSDKSPGKATFLGGTGKYKGIKGILTFTSEAWPELGKGDTMGAGNYKGEYKIGD